MIKINNIVYLLLLSASILSFKEQQKQIPETAKYKEWSLTEKKENDTAKQVFNVKEYGAKGDGKTDDAKAI